MNKKRLIMALCGVGLLAIIVAFANFSTLHYNMTQENENLTVQLTENQKELTIIQEELLIAEENINIEKDRCVVLSEELESTQKELEAVNAYIDILIDEKYEVDYTVTNAEIEIIAKTVWGEARGCNKLEQSAVIWCILNRVDAKNDTIINIVTAPNQFHGYDSSFPVTDEIEALTKDVIARWKLEKVYGGNFGRTLPKEYLYFSADSTGIGNVFRTKWTGTCEVWDWNCWNPYE